MAAKKEWLTIRETAEKLRVSRQQIEKWIVQGRLKSELHETPIGPIRMVRRELVRKPKRLNPGRQPGKAKTESAEIASEK